MQNSGKLPGKKRNRYLKMDPGKTIPAIAYLIFLLMLPAAGFAQLTEVGIHVGAFNYTGDISRAYNLKTHRPAASVFLRSNLAPSASLRYGISGGFLSGDDAFSDDPFILTRNESFNIFLVEAFGLIEFNFLNYKSKHARIHWTPYLNFGLGIFSFWGNRNMDDDFFPVQPVIPMGIGIKYQLSKKFDIGIEASARATFFDMLDGISGPDSPVKNYDYGNKYDFDTYFFIGFTINYVFYFIPCPFDYN
jgi:hypothetical protein